MRRSKKPKARRGTGYMPKGRKIGTCIVAALTWATGSLWLIWHYFMMQPDAFGFDGPHPLEKWWLIAHAMLAFCALWMFGMLWSSHIKPSWNARRRRISGAALFSITAWLIVTGFLLYYLGSESWRSWTSLAHWVVGQATLIAYFTHTARRSA